MCRYHSLSYLLRFLLCTSFLLICKPDLSLLQKYVLNWIVTYVDNAGTATLNTDLKLFLSANNGSNFTQVTLAALPLFATGVKMAKANDVTISNTGTQLKWKIEFANQASGSKETRVTGVSLQY